MLTWFLFGFVFMGIAFWFMFANDKKFEEAEFTEKSIMDHEVRTARGLFFVVLGGYIVIFSGLGLFLKFLFTPW